MRLQAILSWSHSELQKRKRLWTRIHKRQKMGEGMAKIMVIIATAVFMLTNDVTAKKLVVEGDSGWAVPSSPGFYSNWSAKQDFVVGNILVQIYVRFTNRGLSHIGGSL